VDGGELEQPSHVDISPTAWHIIVKLLDPNPKYRLGMGGVTPADGCAEIMRHAWFEVTVVPLD
jgi:hypothetical protein